MTVTEAYAEMERIKEGWFEDIPAAAEKLGALVEKLIEALKEALKEDES